MSSWLTDQTLAAARRLRGSAVITVIIVALLAAAVCSAMTYPSHGPVGLTPLGAVAIVVLILWLMGKLH